MNKRVKKGIDIGAIVLACILFLLGAAILTLSVTKNKDGVPRLFGVTFLDVQTDSMQGTINPADVAVITKVKNASDLKVGDVITFWDLIDLTDDGKDNPVRALNTHRIIEVKPGASEPNFLTKGDNAAAEDEGSVVFGDIVGVYRFRFPGLGHFIRFLQSGWGFFLIIILPLAAFLGYRIYILVRVLLDMKKEKQIAEGNDPETLKKELDALRAQVAGLQDSGEKDSPPSADGK